MALVVPLPFRPKAQDMHIQKLACGWVAREGY